MLNARAARTVEALKARRAFGLRSRVRKRLPRQLPPNGIARDYASELVRRVNRAVRAAFAPLLAAMPEILASAARERGELGRMDAGEGRRVRAAVAAARAHMEHALDPNELEQLAERFASRVATHNRVQLGRQTAAALGADVFVGDVALQSLVEIFASENVALVRGITTQVAARVEQAAISAVQGGRRHEDLARDLEKEMGYPEKRAKLIARDQVGKLYGQINASRQRDIGATHFIWRTVHDSRVRSEHVARDGQRYSYAEPPNGELPGEPILCRCYAEPDFSHLLQEL